MANPVFLAIDTVDAAAARQLVRSVGPEIGGIKLGLEFFSALGPAGVAEVAAGLPVFLDLKLHDIPNTVAGAIRAVAALRPALLTVHVAGGPAMLRAARAAADAIGGGKLRLIGVTVLTSLDDHDLDAIGQRGPASEQARRLAGLAQDCGLDGAVCSPHEVALLRQQCGPDFTLVVPGIRPAGAASGDQKRVMTPAEAMDAGASVIVIGRPITAAADPATAARQIRDELGL